jgi:hypothetical protein
MHVLASGWSACTTAKKKDHKEDVILTEAYRREMENRKRTDAIALRGRIELAKMARLRAERRRADAAAAEFDL